MTKDEIVKALRNCDTDDNSVYQCYDCPTWRRGCTTTMHHAAADMIEQQAAEIERLKSAQSWCYVEE